MGDETVMKISLKISHMFYFLGMFFTSLSYTAITNSYLLQIRYLNTIVRYTALLMFIVSILLSKWKQREFFKIVLIACVVVISAYLTNDIMFVLYIMFVLAVNDIEFRRVCKSLIIINSLLILLVVVSSMVGLIPDDIYIHNGQQAHSMGFLYYSTLAYFTLFITIIGYTLIEGSMKKVIEIFYIIGGILVNYFSYKLTTVRLTLVCFIIYIVAVFLYRNFNLIRYKRFNYVIATIMFPVVGAFSILSSFMYKENSILSALNILMNHRLGFNYIAFEKYGLSIFGRQMIFDAGGFDQNWHNTYFYVDSGYIRTLIGCGVPLFILVIFSYTMISRYAVKTNNYKIFLWSIIVCIFSFVNAIMTNTVINPLLLIVTMIWEQNRNAINKSPSKIYLKEKNSPKKIFE